MASYQGEMEITGTPEVQTIEMVVAEEDDCANLSLWANGPVEFRMDLQEMLELQEMLAGAIRAVYANR